MRNWMALAIVESLSVLILGCGGTSAQPARESAPDGDTKDNLTEKGRDTISSLKDRLSSDKSTGPASPDSGEAAASPTSAAAAPTSLQSAPTRSAKSGAISSATATPESKLSITLPGAITGLLPGQQSITTPSPASRAGSGSEKTSASSVTLGSTLTSGKTSKSTMAESAVSLQQHTQWVSQDASKIEDVLDDNGWCLVGEVLRVGTIYSGSQAYVATRTSHVVVAFRGTDSNDTKEFLSNIATDVRATWKELGFIDDNVRYADTYQDIKVHKGFHNEYEAMLDTLFKYVNRHPDKELFVTGHSLGVALGILCSFDFAVHSGREVTGYYSGSSRVGGSDFRKAFESAVPASYRVVINQDPIPQAPGIIADYVHVGYLLQLYPNGVVDPSGKIDPATSYKELAEAILYFSHHDRSKYSAALADHLSDCESDTDKCPTLSSMSTAAKAERQAATE